mmetsp:Transcript_10544/g.15509  ORF Transcript_10544/g.15509 Transcript_10544/m.15509 type:complete len:315 (+) Transcript_10544:113-1057(+)
MLATSVGIVVPTENTNNFEFQTEELKAERIRDGLCPHCGTQLYEAVRSSFFRKKTSRPLSIFGQCIRGQCIPCLRGDSNVGNAAAVALAAISEPTSRGNSPTALPIATLVSGSDASTQMQTTYSGNVNSFGAYHGKGHLVWKNGDKYVGYFCNGVREGGGTLLFSDGSEYVGNWKNNKMHGQGTRRFPNGNIYNGAYREGKRSGDGRCYYANGDLYIGEWANDKMNGFGRYYYNNGQSFEGFFWEGRRTGTGKYQLNDGRIDICRYENDLRVGEGVRWSENRKRAWRLLGGKVQNRITLQAATEISQRCEAGTS